MIANITALLEAAASLNIKHEFIDANKNVVRLTNNTDLFHLFVNCATPLNNETVSNICKDKEFTYRLLKDVVAQPHTKAYFDPLRNEFREYKSFASFEDILNDVCNHFTFPAVIKRNAGSQGKNVFICKNRDQSKAAIETIFNPLTKNYDFVALAQEYIHSKVELRVVILNKKVELIYYWKNEKAVILEPGELYTRIEAFVEPIFTKVELNWCGMDIILSNDNRLYLIELNSKPGFTYFIRDNGNVNIVSLYKKLLTNLFA